MSSPYIYELVSFVFSLPYLILLTVAGVLCVGRWRRRGTPLVGLAVGILLCSALLSHAMVFMPWAGMSSNMMFLISSAWTGFSYLSWTVGLGLLLFVVLDLQSQLALAAPDESLEPADPAAP